MNRDWPSGLLLGLVVALAVAAAVLFAQMDRDPKVIVRLPTTTTTTVVPTQHRTICQPSYPRSHVQVCTTT